VLLALAYIVVTNYPRLDIITGFSSKNVASGVFFAGRSQESVEEGDNGFSPINLAENIVDRDERSVTSTVFGLKKRKAIYIDGLGVILINKDYNSGQQFDIPKRDKTPKDLPYPYGNLPQKDTVYPNVDYQMLQKAVEDAFDKPGEKIRRSRAVLVIYKDHIIAEKYADGFDKNTPILGWSMTKSFTVSIYGILQKQGRIDIDKPVGIPEWKDDERKNITYNDLLHMNSGLEWDENYETISDVTEMLFLATDMGKVQLEKHPVGKPNESWNYSSGTTNLLAGYLLRKRFSSHQEYLDFWYRELIDKIGMHSALIETDLAGNYVSSSYGWATPRDWAKFGLLYLHNGNWNGEQIIDSSWVDYVRTPTSTSNGRYGAQFWLNAGGHYPDLPKDMFSCNGYQGQMVAMFPSKDLVVVRMGLIEDPEFGFNGFLKNIIQSVQ
jgi:CubicO group peptidase (beta-lactamase class C family)